MQYRWGYFGKTISCYIFDDHTYFVDLTTIIPVLKSDTVSNLYTKGDGKMLQHLISAKQFSNWHQVEELIRISEHYRCLTSDVCAETLRNKIITSLFYEESTRTRFSFESAALKLGARIMSTENAAQFSSAAKGETIQDTIRVVSNYCDAIVLRHPISGTAERAAQVSTVPIINAGDGIGEHPTQALLDIYTIQHELDRLHQFKIAMIGDLLNGRTVHSLARLLCLFKGIKMFFVSPEALAMPQEIKEELSNCGLGFEETECLDDVVNIADIFYVTRIQKNRFVDEREYDKYKNVYCITPTITERMSPDSIIMHPLPRVNEIDQAVDSDQRAVYFRQAENGLYMRMAILAKIIG